MFAIILKSNTYPVNAQNINKWIYKGSEVNEMGDVSDAFIIIVNNQLQGLSVRCDMVHYISRDGNFTEDTVRIKFNNAKTFSHPILGAGTSFFSKHPRVLIDKFKNHDYVKFQPYRGASEISRFRLYGFTNAYKKLNCTY